MKYLRLLLMAFVLFFFSSCFWDSFWEWLNPDDKCTLQLRNFEGDNLRIDGFYYEDVSEYDENAELFILYENGVVMVPGSIKLSEAENRVEKLIDNNPRRDVIDMWGLFEVEDSMISLEYYLPSMYGHHTYLMRGIILNDTTFQMTEGRWSVDSKEESINHLYRFRKTEAKPDSTNKFFM